MAKILTRVAGFFIFSPMQYAPKKVLDLNVAREKIRAYCAYQERCQMEVKQKLLSFGLLPHMADELLVELIHDGFVNEERFALAFARGKVNIKGWGRARIEQALQARGISAPCIAIALKAIDENNYRAKLHVAAEKKWHSLSHEPAPVRKAKTTRYLLGRGFGYAEIVEVVGALLAKQL